MSSSNSKTSNGGGGRGSTSSGAARRQRSRAKRRSPRREPDPEPKKNAPRRLLNKLYIGDLLESVKKEDLERECSRFGKIQEVWLAHHPPGFAFVEFINNKDAADVIDAFDGKMLCGSKVRVEYAKANGGSVNIKRPKRKEPSKATASSNTASLLDRVSPLLSIAVPHRPLMTAGRTIPPLLSLVRSAASPVRRQNELHLRDVEPLSIWNRESSPAPLLPPPRYRGRQLAIGRERSPTSSYQDLMPPPLLSPSITRDLHRVYPLLPPPPPLPLMSTRSRNDSCERDVLPRNRSRSPVYIRRGSPPVLLPSRGRLLGRTPPPISREGSLSLEPRYSPRRSRARECSLRMSRSPPVRKGSPPPRSPLIGERRMSPSKYKTENSLYSRRHSPARRYSSPEKTASSKYLPKAYASPRKERSLSSERQFQRMARLRKSFSRSPRNSCSRDWNRNARSRSPIPRQNSTRSPSPKRFRCDSGRRIAARSPSNGRSASRRSYTPPPVKRYSPIGPRSPPPMSLVKNHSRDRSGRRSSSLDYLPARHSPKHYSSAPGIRSPPIVRSPSPYARRSNSAARSPMMMRRDKSPPIRMRSPPRMYRQASPRFHSPVGSRGHLVRSPYRSPASSDRSPSLRRANHRNSRNSPPPMKSRPFVRSPSSRSGRSYQKGSPPIIRRDSPSSQSPPPTKRMSPLRSRPMSPVTSYMRRRSSPSPSPPRQNRNFRSSVNRQTAPVNSRRSRSRSRSVVRDNSHRASGVGNEQRRYSVNRSVSPRRRSPPLSPRYSPVNKARRTSPMKSGQQMYRSPSGSPRRSSSYFRAGSRRRSPSPLANSPPVVQRSGARRSPSSSPERRPRGNDSWSPPISSQKGGNAKKPATMSSWNDDRHYKSPKRESVSSPPPPSLPTQHHRRHKSSKKLKA